MHPITVQIQNELKSNSDEKTIISFNRVFKESVKCYGVKTFIVTKIAKNYWLKIKHQTKQEIFAICEELLSSDVTEDAFVVATWLPNIADKFEQDDLLIFEHWISFYINNWAKCDSFCNHTVGDFLEKFPKCISQLKSWAKSNNLWLRRAAA
ncbi:MAG: DNA alkylation repair protein, partial [Crenarchaeota archaeon]|nr:DNA alkylation repair protein [Thermoproteota archaeon]